MSYEGEERRAAPHCEFQPLYDERFDRIDARLKEIEPAVKETREKVFNGLSTLPGLVRWLVALLLAFIFGCVALIATSAANNAHIAATLEAMQRQIDKIEVLINAGR